MISNTIGTSGHQSESPPYKYCISSSFCIFEYLTQSSSIKSQDRRPQIKSLDVGSRRFTFAVDAMGREILGRIRFLLDMIPEAVVDGDGHAEEGVEGGGVKFISELRLAENWWAASHSKASISNMDSV